MCRNKFVMWIEIAIITESKRLFPASDFNKYTKPPVIAYANEAIIGNIEIRKGSL